MVDSKNFKLEQKRRIQIKHSEFNEYLFVNDKKFFFKKTKKIVIQKKKDFAKRYLFMRTTLVKYFLTITHSCLYMRLDKTRSKYENIIQNIRHILEEKNDLVDKIQNDNQELKIYYDKMKTNAKSAYEENDSLKKRIIILESKMQLNTEKFRELFETNLNDIKSKILFNK
jgi:hypothetical protein